MSSNPHIIEPVKLPKYSTPILTKNESDFNEAERMVSGLLYDPNQAELKNGARHAKLKMQQFNTSDCRDMELRKKLLEELLGTYNNVIIEPPFFCDYGTNIDFGNNCYLNHNCCFLDVCNISIGSNTMFGPNVQIYTASHPLDPIERRGRELGKPVAIGNDCWIGGSAVILPGVTIGDGVVVGAGSVVTKNVEPYVVVAGNPAKVIKRIEKSANLNKA
jgi:maltose O-acetyltransferase